MNFSQVRYIVLEDSTVNAINGPISSERQVNLSKRQLHNWSGIQFINATVDKISTGTFNITHTVSYLL